MVRFFLGLLVVGGIEGGWITFEVGMVALVGMGGAVADGEEKWFCL